MMPFLTPISAILQCKIHNVKGTKMGLKMPFDGINGTYPLMPHIRKIAFGLIHASI